MPWCTASTACRGSQLAVRHVRSGGSKLHYLTLLNGTSAWHEDCRLQLLGRHAEPPEGEPLGWAVWLRLI